MKEAILVGKQTTRTVSDDYMVVRVDANGRLIIGAMVHLTPIQKGRIFDTPVLAATDFFVADLAPTNSPTTFRVYVCLDTIGVFSVQRTVGAATVAEEMNAGGALNADAAYMFDILVNNAETINFQTSVGAQILYCLVMELPGAIG